MRRSTGKSGVYRRQNALGWLFSVLVTVLVLLVVFLIWLMPLRVVGDTMAPTLAEDEIVLADRLGKYWKRPGRGDVILFADNEGDYCIKRIVALPGERVELVGGQVFLNSCPLDETMYAVNPMGDMESVTVPEGAVFVLGDNRALMHDSRVESVGCIPYERILGVLRFRISPMEKLTMYR